MYGRIHHFPWPDHHPPPFRLIPSIMGTMKNWIQGGQLTPCYGETVLEETDRTPAKAGIQENEQDVSEQETAIPNTTKTASMKTITAADVENRQAADIRLADFRMSPRNQSKDLDSNRVVVVHCKAGKGRSGSVSVSYLISECGWSKTDAMQRFTERRMLPGFGPGVSIPSQVRWIDYIVRWASNNKRYLDGPVEVVEVHFWGLRNGVKVDIEGFVDEGRKIKIFHSFVKGERIIVEGNPPGGGGIGNMVRDMLDPAGTDTGIIPIAVESRIESGDQPLDSHQSVAPRNSPSKLLQKGKLAAKFMAKLVLAGGSSSGFNTRRVLIPQSEASSDYQDVGPDEPGGRAIIFKPNNPVILHTKDINISVERRSKGRSSAIGLSITTAVAHVWFNAFFEGEGPERLYRGKEPLNSGVFGIDWDAMDGLKGSRKKGVKAFDKMEVVWRIPTDKEANSPEDIAKKTEEIKEPGPGDMVSIPKAADWRGENTESLDPDDTRQLGMVHEGGIDENDNNKTLPKVQIEQDTENGRNNAEIAPNERKNVKIKTESDSDLNDLNIVKRAGQKESN